MSVFSVHKWKIEKNRITAQFWSFDFKQGVIMRKVNGSQADRQLEKRDGASKRSLSALCVHQPLNIVHPLAVFCDWRGCGCKSWASLVTHCSLTNAVPYFC